MVDVAREAGVAHITVSRVLNGHPSVRPETRLRVDAAIAKLGYRRNDLARALKSGRSRTLGVVIAGSSLHELPKVLLGVENAASTTGHAVTLASWQRDSGQPLADTVDRIVGQGVEGLVIIADRPAIIDSVERLHPRIPTCVVMSGDFDNERIASVEFDQVDGARTATEYLLDLGHEQVAHLSGRVDTFDAAARIDGWRSRMREAGVMDPLLYDGDFTARAGHELGVQLLGARELPSAIFVGNDLMAMGLLAALADRGVSVPADMSVVGFDDMAGAEYVGPGLTTVRQEFEALGRTSIEAVQRMLDGDRPHHVRLSTELVVRRSARERSPDRGTRSGAVAT